MNRQEQAAQNRVIDIFVRNGAVFTASKATFERVSLEAVRAVSEHLRDTVIEELHRAGKLRDDALDQEYAVRRTHAGIADYCRNRRLAIENARETIHLDKAAWSAVLTMLGLDEAHYRRLAERPTEKDQADFDNRSHFMGCPRE